MYKNVLGDDIFTSFVISCEPEISISELKNESYKIKSSFPSKEVSNRNGYHSPNFGAKLKCDETKYPELCKLETIFLNFSSDFLHSNNFIIKPKICEWWININPLNSYNILHTHLRSDLIGIFYIQCTDETSSLSILRNDGSIYSKLYAHKPEQLKFSLPPIPGRLYLLPGHLYHYVSTNFNEDDRISVSFNLFCE